MNLKRSSDLQLNSSTSAFWFHLMIKRTLNLIGEVLNMLHFRKSAIFWFLVASVQLLSCTADQILDDRFKDFIDLVKKGAGSSDLRYDTIKYDKLDLLDRVSDDFKEKCLEIFGPLNSDKIVGLSKAEYAYESLDKRCKRFVCDFINKISEKYRWQIKWQMESMLNQGNIIEFLVHVNTVRKDKTKMKEKMKNLQVKYKGMKDDETELWVILHEYDWGILGDLYSEDEPSNADEKEDPAMCYMTIRARFNIFITLVKKRVKSTNARDYDKIDDLHGVEHDFKLDLLEDFETENTFKWASILENQEMPEYAYETLNKICKRKYYAIKNTFEPAKIKELVTFGEDFKEKFQKKEIIEFLVHMNTVKKNKRKMETEMMRWQNKYKGMKDYEAELCIILYENEKYKGIIAKYYPKPAQKCSFNFGSTKRTLCE